MYKHMVGVIKETPEKRFISQADKDKYDNYSFMKKEDTYTKEEIDSLSDQLIVSNLEYNGTPQVVNNQSKKGFIENFKIEGDTIQSSSNLANIIHLGYKNGDKYSIKVKTVGKNLFDINLLYDQIKHIYGVSRTDRGIKLDASENAVCSAIRDLGTLVNIPLNPKKKYVIRQVVNTDTSLCARIEFVHKSGKRNEVQYTTEGEYYINSLSGDEVVGYAIEWYTQSNLDYTIIEDVAVYEIEEDVTSPPKYVEFKEDVREIVIPEPLKKIGNLSDKLIVENNRIKLIQNIGKISLAENLVFETNPTKLTNTIKFCALINANSTNVGSYKGYQCISNFLPYGFATNESSGTDYDYDHILVEKYNNRKYAVIFIGIDKIEAYTDEDTYVDKVRAYLKDVGAYVLYCLSTPIEHDLGEINGLLSYENYTVFISDNNISPNKITCEIPSNIGDSLFTANNQIEVIRNKVDAIKSNVSENSLKYEFTLNDVYEARKGYVEDFEIKGKTAYDLSSFITHSNISSTVAQRDITILEKSNKRIEFVANEAFDLAEHSSNGYGYVIFYGLTTKHLKPKTKYRVSLDFHSDFNFDKQPSIIFNKNDGSVKNSNSAKDTSTMQGRLSVILTTNDTITDEGCPLFIGFDKATFKQRQRLIVENISIVELTDVEDVTVSYSDNSTLLNVGNNITIRNNSGNLIDFSNAAGVKLSRAENNIKDGLEVTFDSKDSCIVHNTLTTTTNNDLFFTLHPKYNYLGDLVSKMYYELTWKCEVLEGDISQIRQNDVIMMPVITTYKNRIGAFRATGIANSNPVFNNRLVFNYNSVKESNLLFRINVNKSGYKIRFYDIRLTPTNTYIVSETDHNSYVEEVNKESNEVTIDLSKYGIEDGLKSLPDGTCDRIFKNNGKYYLEQNVGTVVLDGSRAYSILDSNSPQRIRGWSKTDTVFKKGSKSYNSLMLYSGTTNGTITGNVPNDEGTDITHIEFLAVDHNGNTVISLSKEVVPTIEDYKNYFKNNPVTVYAQLKEPKIIELDEQLDLISYNGTNTLYVENENICPVVSYKKANNINNTVNVLIDKVKQLQSNNNKLDLLTLKSIYNGDMSNLEVNLMFRSNTVNEIDIDLYNLINKVIDSNLSDNETIGDMIDFFFMVDKLNMIMVEDLYMKLESNMN